MLPLPAVPFEARRMVCVSVSRKATVSIEGATYSVPSRWVRLEATAYVGVEDVQLVCCSEQIRHRRVARGQREIRYRHYLAELARKPQAVRQVADELTAELGEPFERFWRRLLVHLAPLEAARRFAAVLALIGEYGEANVREALQAMLTQGRLDLLSVGEALRSRRRPPAVTVPAALAHIEIESARAADYDALLGGGVQ